MARVPHRRRRWVAALLAVSAAVVLIAPAAHAEVTPTITFRGGRLTPLVCPSVPEPRSLSIDEGAWVNVENETGAAATKHVDNLVRPTIGAGEGRSVRLPPGTHAVRLVPDCPAHGNLVAAVIDVRAAPPPTASAGSTSGARSGSPTASLPGQPDPAGADRSGLGPPGGWPPPGPPPPGPPPGALPAGAPPAIVVPSVQVVPYTVENPDEDPHGGHLLAMVATICVLGVTAAIIRAILAQRTRRVIAYK